MHYLYFNSSMGCSIALSWGFAFARPRRVLRFRCVWMLPWSWAVPRRTWVSHPFFARRGCIQNTCGMHPEHVQDASRMCARAGRIWDVCKCYLGAELYCSSYKIVIAAQRPLMNKEFRVTSQILPKLSVFVVPMVLTTHTNVWPHKLHICYLWPQIFWIFY